MGFGKARNPSYEIVDDMLCEKCHESEATIDCTAVDDGVAKSMLLCEECFTSTAEPAEIGLHAAMKTARCSYCGGKAVSGGTDSFESPAAGQPMKFSCASCGAELWRYWQGQIEHVPQHLPQEEQMAKMRVLFEQAESYVTEWARKRDAQ